MLDMYLFNWQPVYHFPLYKIIHVTSKNFCCPSISIQPYYDYIHNHMINRSSTSLLSLFNIHLRNLKAYIVWLSRPHDYICGAWVIRHLPKIIKHSNTSHRLNRKSSNICQPQRLQLHGYMPSGTSHSFATFMSGSGRIAWCCSVPGSTIQCN